MSKKVVYYTTKSIKSLLDFVIIVVIICAVFIGSFYAVGIKPYIVLSGSMEPTIHTGSLCFVDTTYKFDDVKKDDVIAFTHSNMMITHRVVYVSNKDNQKSFTTRGDANRVVDEGVTTKANFVGKTLFSIPYIGFVCNALHTMQALICVGVVVILYVILDIFCNKMKSDKKQNND